MQKDELLQLLNRYKQGPMSPVLIRDLFNGSRKFNYPIPRYNYIDQLGIIHFTDYVIYNVTIPVFDDSILIDSKIVDSSGELVRGWAIRVVQIFKECNFNYQTPSVLVAIHNYESNDMAHHLTGYQLCFSPNIKLLINESGGFRIEISRSNSPVAVNFDFPIEYFNDIAPRHEKIIKFFFEYWLRDINHQKDSPFVKSNRSRLYSLLSKFTPEFRWMDRRKPSSKYYGRVIEQLTQKQDKKNQEIFQYYYDHAVYFKSCLMDWGFAPSKISYFETMTGQNCKVIFCSGNHATIIELDYHISSSNPYCKIRVGNASLSLNFIDFYNKIYLDIIRIWLGYFIKVPTTDFLDHNSYGNFRLEIFLLVLHYCMSFKSPQITDNTKSNDFDKTYQDIFDPEVFECLLDLKRYLNVTEMAHVYGKDDDNILASKQNDLTTSQVKLLFLAYDVKTADLILEKVCYLLDKEVVTD
ncbi:MAG: hypothetical protein KC646_00770 [Candidatus Cloacimonetes bacterium]|nr:hypothetical protein [Candidatus Cloacimonadota bacterium]